jgi:uncharacterized protein (DUF1015 family)
MANVHPFRPWRYTAQAGPLEKLATQPYDTIPPELERAYRASGPHNLVWLILPGDDYAGAAARLDAWVAEGVLAQDETPALYGYEQRFVLPGTGERLVRRGFIGLGDLEDYGATVHRHELTLPAPVADRLELLRQTRAQFGSIFMMYPDAEGAVEGLLEGEEIAAFGDHQGTEHRVWRVQDGERIAAVQAAMRDRPLVIVDGHHRYEAALRYGRERRVMMNFVRMESLGLRTLAAHRVVSGLPGFRAEELMRLGTRVDEVQFGAPAGRVRFGIALPGGLWQIELDRAVGELNLTVLHERVLHRVLGITPDAIARREFVAPCRGMETAIGMVESGRAQVAFLVEALEVTEVARLALAGRTLPQKSTDFYPKLASGVTIYRFGG